MTDIIKYFDKKLGFDTNKDTAIELLKETIIFLDEFKIDYFLISGSLLGLVRHNDFIPWDDDIDLMVDSSILEKLPEINKKYSSKLNFITAGNYIVKTCFPTKDIKINFKYWEKNLLNKEASYYWPFIDLFIFNKVKDTNKISFFKKEWDFAEFFPCEKVIFNNLSVFIPKNPDYFLRINYGKNYMTELVSSKYNHKLERSIGKTYKITMEEYIKLI